MRPIVSETSTFSKLDNFTDKFIISVNQQRLLASTAAIRALLKQKWFAAGFCYTIIKCLVCPATIKTIQLTYRRDVKKKQNCCFRLQITFFIFVLLNKGSYPLLKVLFAIVVHWCSNETLLLFFFLFFAIWKTRAGLNDCSKVYSLFLSYSYCFLKLILCLKIYCLY